jgi:hypothetical protein
MQSDFEIRHFALPSVFDCEAEVSGNTLDRQDFWLAISRELHREPETSQPTEEFNSPSGFGVRVILSVPSGISRRRSVEMKPVLDGTLTALHRLIGSETELLSDRLTAMLGVSKQEVNTLLKCEHRKVLGPHKAIVLRGDGLQFSPKDDLCDAGE